MKTELRRDIESLPPSGEPSTVAGPGPAAPAPAVPRAISMSVETVSEYESFVDLERAWNSLVEKAGIDHPFLTHEWLRTWWECFGAGKELCILVVRAGPKIVAIAPLMRAHAWRYGLKVRVLQSIYNSYTERTDFIVAGWHREAYRAIWRALLNQRARWDVLELCQIPAGSDILKEVPQLAREDKHLVVVRPSSSSPYVSLAGSWESYFRSLKSGLRWNVRNGLKRLAELGQVDFEVVSSGEQLERALDEGFRIEAAGWKGEAGTAISCCPDLRRFYTKLAERAARRGWLRLHFLTLNGHRIAFDYSLCYGNKLCSLKVGYDPEYARCSPSRLLTYMVLRDAFERGVAEYRFLGEAEWWKLRWARETGPHYWLHIFSDRLRGRLLYSVKSRVVPSLRRLYQTSRAAALGLREGIRASRRPRGGA